MWINMIWYESIGFYTSAYDTYVQIELSDNKVAEEIADTQPRGACLV